MKLLTSLGELGIGEQVGIKFMNKERHNQKEINVWVCIADVIHKFEEQDLTFRKMRTGEVMRTTKKVQFKINLLNRSNRFGSYLGIRNEWSMKFECAWVYNKLSWEIYKLENENDKLEIIKNIMADNLEHKEEDMELQMLPYFLSNPWLDFGESRG